MTPTRRQWLAGAGAAMLLPRPASATRPHDELDRAQRMPAIEGLKLLAGVTARDVAARLDLDTARAGLTIDAELARRFPDAPQRGPEGKAPPLGPWLSARANGNIGTLPEGETVFALLLQRQAGTMTPATVWRRLHTELRRLHSQAAPLFAAVGHPHGTIGARYSALWADERYLYPDSDAGRTRAIADMTRALTAARERVAPTFGSVPPQCLDLEVRALSTAEIAAGRGGYRDLPAPGQRGTYVVDLKEIRRRPAWTLPSVVAHELLPGHMLQMPIEAETPPHPLRLDYAPVFPEAWATYAEQLAGAIGAYPDPLSRLGHLHWLLFRTCRGLVDIGMHLRGWSVDEARARLVAWHGEPAYFAPFDADLERIRREPATRTAEAMAWLALADRARRHKGPALVAWHRRILAGGRKRIETLPA